MDHIWRELASHMDYLTTTSGATQVAPLNPVQIHLFAHVMIQSQCL